jgi:hypothetical protein
MTGKNWSNPDIVSASLDRSSHFGWPVCAHADQQSPTTLAARIQHRQVILPKMDTSSACSHGNVNPVVHDHRNTTSHRQHCTHMLHQLGIAERFLSQLHHINSAINRSR